jgi:phage terminase small subunit
MIKSVMKEQVVFKVVQGPYEVKEVRELEHAWPKDKLYASQRARAKETVTETTKILPGRWALLRFVNGKLKMANPNTFKNKKDVDQLFLSIAPVGAILR